MQKRFKEGVPVARMRVLPYKMAEYRRVHIAINSIVKHPPKKRSTFVGGFKGKGHPFLSHEFGVPI